MNKNNFAYKKYLSRYNKIQDAYIEGKYTLGECEKMNDMAWNQCVMESADSDIGLVTRLLSRVESGLELPSDLCEEIVEFLQGTEGRFNLDDYDDTDDAINDDDDDDDDYDDDDECGGYGNDDECGGYGNDAECGFGGFGSDSWEATDDEGEEDKDDKDDFGSKTEPSSDVSEDLDFGFGFDI
jgi:hypothetical protein